MRKSITIQEINNHQVIYQKENITIHQKNRTLQIIAEDDQIAQHFAKIFENLNFEPPAKKEKIMVKVSNQEEKRLTICQNNRPLLEASLSDATELQKLFILWMTCLQESSQRTQSFTKIQKQQNLYQCQTIIGKDESFYQSSKLEEILRLIKRATLRKLLGMEEIVYLVTPGDMYDMGYMAAESFLLNKNAKISSCYQQNTLQTILKESSYPKYHYDLDQNPIDPKRYPYLWQEIQKDHVELRMELIEEIYFLTYLINTETNIIMEESIKEKLQDSLMNLEFKRQNSYSRSKKQEERKKEYA